MSEKTVLGVPGMVYQGSVRSYSRTAGWTNSLRWIGEKKYALGLQLQLIDAGYDSTCAEDGPNAIVDATRAGNEDGTVIEAPVNRWERRINRVEKSIYEHFDLVSELETPENVAELKKQVDDREFDSLSYAGSDQVEEDAYEWFKLIIAGADSFVVFQPVVTLTQTVSDRYDKSQFLQNNVGKILTREQMSSLEGAPAFVLNDRPAVPSGVFFETRAGYLKNDPQFVSIAQSKWEVTTEWELGYWATKMYESAT